MAKGANRKKLLLEEFEPRSELVVAEHRIERARFPAIDAHNHLSGWATPDGIARLVAEMEACNVKAVFHLPMAPDRPVPEDVRLFKQAWPRRFYVLAVLAWDTTLAEGGDAGVRLAADLERAVRQGAQGLKIHKSLGLSVRDAAGRLVMPHDPRIAAVFAKCAELGVPCLYHVADPKAFFRPLDRFNERYEELQANPSWHFYGKDFPTYEALMESQERLIEAHPTTAFQSAHLASSSEDLGYVAGLLNRYPNLHVDFSARIAELGRQPYTAREFFVRYADRIVYATDCTPEAEVQRTYMRFLETRDEWFPYLPGDARGQQGRWRICGIGLPDDVLEKVYFRNAERLWGPPT